MRKGNSEKRKFSTLQLTFWCSWCAFTSFAALYFKANGLSDAAIGLALSFSTLGGIAGQFLWGYLCDRLKTIKRNFIAANIMIALVTGSFLFFTTTPVVWGLMFLLGFAQVPQPSILDTWILKKLPGKESEYGQIRLWASVGFAFFALGFGYVIRRFGFTVMFIGSAVFITLTLVVSFGLKDIRDDTGRMGLLKSFKELYTNRRYLFLILVGFIIGLAYRTIHLLLPLIVVSVNGTSWDLGISYFLGVITEAPMLLASKQLSKRLKPATLLFLSVLLFGVHFFILIFAAAPWMVMASMVAQGLAFGNYLPSIRLFVYQHAPENLRTSAQTLADAVCSSLTAVIGSAAGGVIMQSYGVKAVLYISLGLLLLAGFILIPEVLSRKREC